MKKVAGFLHGELFMPQPDIQHIPKMICRRLSSVGGLRRGICQHFLLDLPIGAAIKVLVDCFAQVIVPGQISSLPAPVFSFINIFSSAWHGKPSVSLSN